MKSDDKCEAYSTIQASLVFVAIVQVRAQQVDNIPKIKIYSNVKGHINLNAN